MSRHAKIAVITVPAACLLILLIAMLPPVRTRLQVWSAEIQLALNPPEEVVFIPQEQQNQIDIFVSATMQALNAPSETPSPTMIAETPSGPTSTPTHTPTPTMTPTPLPGAAQITGMKFQSQNGLWNSCAPTALAVNLSFWGPDVTRNEVATVVRGGSPKDREDDKNVMPYELEEYVREETNLRMLVRSGGTLDVLKALIAAGYPVVVEKEDTLQGIGWLGHYLTLTGFDDATQMFTSMDTYHGDGTKYSYEQIETSWRAFNFLFFFVYPPEDENTVLNILGPYANDEWATRHALEIAQQETTTKEGLALYYAWFNLGTSYVQLYDYGPASIAFDNAFNAYAQLEKENRPYRMIWYQTGPYFAYYYTGRYQDVYDLATQTLDAMTKPILEESFYWRGLAREALGDIPGAIDDLRMSVALNPNFDPGWAQLACLSP